MNKIYLGIDNGVSGSIGIIGDSTAPRFHSIPTISQQDYTKKKQNITRVDVIGFENIIKDIKEISLLMDSSLFAVLERPMVNPGRFKATKSALRCLEAELIILEFWKIPYMFIDSKEWQRMLLPKGCKKEELKKASLDIGIRLFPVFKEQIIKHKDADGLLIGEYSRRKNL
jgi:hypothetical protein